MDNMKNKITYILAIIFISGSFLSAETDVKEAKNAIISSHTNFAKSEIDRKCQKLQKKIQELEDELSHQVSQDRRSDIMNKISKYQERLNSLIQLKGSMEALNIKSL